MISEDFLCEDCGYRAPKSGNCPRCDAELMSLKESEQDPYAAEDDEQEETGNFMFDDDFDFSDEAAMI